METVVHETAFIKLCKGRFQQLIGCIQRQHEACPKKFISSTRDGCNKIFFGGSSNANYNANYTRLFFQLLPSDPENPKL